MIRRVGPAGLALARAIDDALAPRGLRLRLRDGYETVVYLHAPADGAIREPVLYMHGIQSHPGWFMESASCLAGRGHPVFQVTRRGSGENAADRGHAANAEQLLDDLDDAAAMIRERTGSDKLHLLGVSWGGKLLACYALRRSGIASLTMVAPGIVPLVDVSPWKKLAIGLCLLAAPRRRFAIPLNEPHLFTDSMGMRAFIRGDDFALRRATARLLFASRQLDRMIARAPDGVLSLPTSLILAERDRIIDNARTRRVVERFTGGEAHIQELPAAHVLEFEKDPTAYFDTLVKCIGGKSSL